VGLEADLQGALEKERSTVTNNFQFTIGMLDAGRLFTGYSQAKPAILFLPAGEGWL
jgi:hypothetical protein